jgi:hypothetical protein
MVKIAVNGNTAYDTILVSHNLLADNLNNFDENNINISYLVSDIKEQL